MFSLILFLLEKLSERRFNNEKFEKVTALYERLSRDDELQG